MSGPDTPVSGPVLLVSRSGRGLSAYVRARPTEQSGAGQATAKGLVPAVFLDRDGVINENRAQYVRSWEEFTFLPHVFEPLRRLAASPHLIVVVSNQSAVGRGCLSLADLQGIHERMLATISARGGRVDAGCYCPHTPSDGCACRKPRTGLLTRAASELEIDLDRSYVVGDARSDMEAAIGAGCAPVLVLTGRGLSQRSRIPAPLLGQCHVADDLADAVEWILSRETDLPCHVATSGPCHESC
jgi:histidinol-phosphate phosphatase family protein